MITFEEAGITEEAWDDLQTLRSNATFEATLYKWLPEFFTFNNGDEHPAFDAINFGDTVYRVGFDLADNLGTPLSYTPVTDMKDGTRVSLVVDGDDLIVFAISDTGIARSIFGGSWTEIVADVDVIYIGATAGDTVHYITFDSTSRNYQFHAAQYDGSWSVLDSDIYWGYVINSFDAKRIGGKDILVMASDMPGYFSTSVVGTTPIKKILPSGGIFRFYYQYESWSDVADVERIDQWNDFRNRSNVHLTTIDDVLWLSATSSDGTKDNPLTGHRVYTSKDGIHWSRGEYLPITDEGSSGMIYLALAGAVYGLEYITIHSGVRTLWFGSPDLSTTLNITPYINQLDVNRQDVQQIQMVVDNAAGRLDSFLNNGAGVFNLILKLGYNDNLIQVGIFEIDTIVPSKDIPVRMVALTGRDHFSWLMTRTESEQFIYWLPQVIGIDEYLDSTGTGYGGMTHTAPSDAGSFEAFDGALQNVTSNDEVIAYNTWLTDNWNGCVEAWTELSTLGNSEYVGLVFRSPDKDNGMIYLFNQSDDKLYLKIREAGVDTTLWSSGAMGWASTIVGHFLRAEFRFSKIRLYTSDDASGVSVSWTFQHEEILDGQSADPDEPLSQSGFVGAIGRGYSALDTVYPEIGVYPIGDLPEDFEPFEPPAPEAPPEPPDPEADSDWSYTFDFTETDGGFISEGTQNSTWTFGEGWTGHSIQLDKVIPFARDITGLILYWDMDVPVHSAAPNSATYYLKYTDLVYTVTNTFFYGYSSDGPHSATSIPLYNHPDTVSPERLADEFVMRLESPQVLVIIDGGTQAVYYGTPTLTAITFTGQGTNPFTLAPAPEFTYEVSDLDVTFTNTTFVPDGMTIDTWLWDFGDGFFSSDENPVHTFADFTTYTVTLTATPVVGLAADIEHDVNVGWTHTFDFTIDEQGWIGIGSFPNKPAYSAGVGWVTYDHGSAAPFIRTVPIERFFSNTNLSSIRVIASYTQGPFNDPTVQNGYNLGLHYNGEGSSTFHSAKSVFASDMPSGTFDDTWSVGHDDIDRVQISLNSSQWFNAAHFGGSVTITEITFTGSGTNPFL